MTKLWSNQILILALCLLIASLGQTERRRTAEENKVLATRLESALKSQKPDFMYWEPKNYGTERLTSSPSPIEMWDFNGDNIPDAVLDGWEPLFSGEPVDNFMVGVAEGDFHVVLAAMSKGDVYVVNEIVREKIGKPSQLPLHFDGENFLLDYRIKVGQISKKKKFLLGIEFYPSNNTDQPIQYAYKSGKFEKQ